MWGVGGTQKQPKVSPGNRKNEARGKVSAELPAGQVCDPSQSLICDLMPVALEQPSPAASWDSLEPTGRGMRSTRCRAQAQELGVRSSCLPCPARAHPRGKAKEKNYLSQ